MMADEEDFLSRWSRRKRSVAEEAPAVEADAAQATGSVDEPETEEDEAVLLERLGLPVPETLKEGDDFSGFMQTGVPQFLRKRALRVLWRSNPVLANLDGLNDYDEDFTSPELTQKVLATGYQVGRGFVRQVLEDTDPERPEVEEAETEIALAKEDPVAGEEEIRARAEDENDLPEPRRPRRMQFERKV